MWACGQPGWDKGGLARPACGIEIPASPSPRRERACCMYFHVWAVLDRPRVRPPTKPAQPASRTDRQTDRQPAGQTYRHTDRRLQASRTDICRQTPADRRQQDRRLQDRRLQPAGQTPRLQPDRRLQPDACSSKGAGRGGRLVCLSSAPSGRCMVAAVRCGLLLCAREQANNERTNERTSGRSQLGYMHACMRARWVGR